MSTKAGLRLAVLPPDSKDEIVLDYGKIRKASLSIAAINHPLRKKILGLLESGNKITVTEIFKKIKTEQSVASQHLAVLRRAEILTAQRNGKFIYYSINQKRLSEVYALIEELIESK